MQHKNIYRNVGSLEQLFGLRDFRLIGGKADNMRAIDLYNANGLSLTVVPDRGMDILSLSYKGTNFSFLSKTGIVGPQYFQENGTVGFLRNFFVGFLTTCGLSYMGSPCIDYEEKLGLHGLISNIPASNVCPSIDYNEDLTSISVKGNVVESKVFGENLLLQRNIKLKAFHDEIEIIDTITNNDFEPSSFMLLYHINFGYPLLSSDCELVLPTKKVTPRDEDALKDLENWMQIVEPIDGFKEQVFFHELEADSEGIVSYMLINKKLGLAVEVSYPKEHLQYFTQWKSMKSGEYVLGLEPGNCHVLGRDIARKNNDLVYLQAGESKTISVKVKVHSSDDAIIKACKRIKSVLN